MKLCVKYVGATLSELKIQTCLKIYFNRNLKHVVTTIYLSEINEVTCHINIFVFCSQNLAVCQKAESKLGPKSSVKVSLIFCCNVDSLILPSHSVKNMDGIIYL